MTDAKAVSPPPPHEEAAAAAAVPDHEAKKSFVELKPREVAEKIADRIDRCHRQITQRPTTRADVAAMIVETFEWLRSNLEFSILTHAPDDRNFTMFEYACLSICGLRLVDKAEADLIAQSASKMEHEMRRMQNGQPSDTLMIEAIVHRLRLMLLNFHHYTELSVKITEEKDEPPPGANSTITERMAVANDRAELEAKRHDPLHVDVPFFKPYFYEKEAGIQPTDDAAVVKAVYSLSKTTFLCACVPWVWKTGIPNLELIKLYCRLMFWTDFGEWVSSQHQPRKTAELISEEALHTMRKRFFQSMSKRQHVELNSAAITDFGNQLFSIFSPAGCYYEYIRTRGKAKANDASVVRFHNEASRLDPTNLLGDAAIDSLKSIVTTTKLEEQKEGVTPKLQADFRVLMKFVLTFETTTKQSFRGYILFPDELHKRRAEIDRETKYEVPLRLTRPQIILYGKTIRVRHGRAFYEVQSLTDACMLWVHLVMNAGYGGKLENDQSIAEFAENFGIVP